MAKSTTDLPAAGPITGAEIVKLVQDGLDKNAAVSVLLAGVGTDDQTAAEVPFTPAGNLVAEDVQAALEELDGEKAALSHTHTLSQVTDAGTAAAADTGDFATAAQGASADTAVQPGDGLPEDAVAGAQNVDATKLNRLQRYTGAGHTWTFDGAGAAGVVPIINKGTGAITPASGTATIEGATSIPQDKIAAAIYYAAGANVRLVVEA